MWCSGTHSTHDSTTGTACRRHGPRHEQTAKQTQIDRSVADATPTMLQAVAAHLSSASSRLSPHLVSKPASGNTLLPERNAALADSELQRQLTGDTAGYRPSPLSPWAWDNELPAACIRWSFSRTRELTLTTSIRRAPTAAVTVLPAPPTSEQLDLRSIQFVAPGHAPGPLVPGRSHSVQEMLEATDTDCFVVVHRGRIVHESYMNSVEADTRRLGMSMGKTLTAGLVGILIDRGLIVVSAKLTEYIPELAATGYNGATVQNALDMCVGVDFDEAGVYGGDDYHSSEMFKATMSWGSCASQLRMILLHMLLVVALAAKTIVPWLHIDGPALLCASPAQTRKRSSPSRTAGPGPTTRTCSSKGRTAADASTASTSTKAASRRCSAGYSSA